MIRRHLARLVSGGDHPKGEAVTSREDAIRQLEAALVRWRSFIILGDMQRRAYLEQGDDSGEELYRNVAGRIAEENLRLRARVAELESREDTP